ncbi:MAG: FecR/PupR family sigma factor regulator, partial [Rhodocyclales bacterium]|nr:FecR/PupR family sigma factor regulator [Rhodocyclales bacterium]
MSAHSRQPASGPAIDPAIVRQAVAWLVRLQSGQPDQRAQAGCRAWR